MQQIRLLIADDHNILRKGLIDILRNYNDICVIAEAEDGESLITKNDIFKPDVILTDIEMPVMNGLKAAKKILQKDPKAKILFLSMHFSDEHIYRIESIGGSGLISKSIIQDELVTAIRTVAQGKKYYLGKTEKDIIGIKKRFEKIIKKDTDTMSLTIRQKSILHLIAEGLTSEKIAERLKIGKRTVDAQRSDIMSKMNLTTLAELMKFAIHYSEINKNHISLQ